MERRRETDLRRWLAAEASNEAEAEAAFDDVMATMPRLTPHGGFAERVLWTVQPDPAPRWAIWTWGWHAATVAGLVLTAAAYGLLPVVRWLPIEGPSFGSILETAARGLAWTAEWLAAGLGVWRLLVTVGNALGVAATTPQVGSALLASAMLGVAALYVLNRLLALERRTWI